MSRKLTNQGVSCILLCGFLLVNIFAIITTSFFLHDSKKQYKTQAYSTSKNYADVLSNNIVKTFDKAELIVNSTSNQIENFGLSVSTQNYITEESKYLADLHNIVFINYKGQVVYSVSESPKFNFNQSKFFQDTINKHTQEIIIYHEKIRNEQHIVFSKQITNQKNETIGVLALMIPIASFMQNFHNLDVGPHGLLALRDENLKFIARFPPVNIGQENSLPSKTFIELSQRVNAGSYEAITPLDQKARIFSFKKINRFNYYVIVGISEEDFLIPWNKEFFQFTSIYFFFSIMCALFSYTIYFLWKKESQKENRLSSVLQSSSEGMYGIDDNGLCTFCNHKALTLLGYTHEQDLVGQHIHQIIFTDSLVEFDFSKNSNIEKVLKRKDGSTFHADIWQHPQIYDNEISTSIITFVDISDKKDMDKLVWKQANYDSLTGIPNRSFFEEKLQETINQSLVDNSNFAVLFIDLDHFKDINDNLGHHAGDELLCQVAQRLNNCVRDRDIVARLGGDEFTIILTQIKEKSHIERVCSKIIQEIQKPFIVHNHPCNIGSSIGITFFPEDTTSLEGLLQNADKAMYVAKESGRNCYSFFSKDLDLMIKKRLEMSNDLKKSIENHELELFAQPIVNTNTGKIVKAEVLLRWKHATKGYINPNDFIPISEKNGMIHPIGEWVFKQSTLWLKCFLEKHPEHNDFQLSINVSPLQFMNSHFVENIKSHIEILNLPKGSVIVELTEGILLDHNHNTHDKFLELKDLGIKIAIDDFGTGYSAMSYLYKYDIDFIKVDRSFISDLKQDKNKKITRSLVSMARNLGIEVIAEGVETVEQAVFLQDIHCDYSQGFLFSKPIAIETLQPLIH